MATDIAEFVGAAIGINLITGLPLFPAALIVGVAAFFILGLQSRGFRKFEAVIAASSASSWLRSASRCSAPGRTGRGSGTAC